MESESKQGPSLPEEVHAEPSTEGDTDWKAMACKWDCLAKSNSEKAKSYDELQEQSKSELQKAQEKAAAYKRQVDELNAKAEREAVRAKVAKDTGVPAELISGDDEESMRAFAQAVAKWGKPSSAPRTRRPGSFSNDAGDGKDAARRELARQLFGSGE
ncbi:hypothetical protein [Parafannyhessea sp. LCP21S3_E6]|uniref:hypothetical protein n=1 Tax=unclassified Parafannyhessea TaxID=2847323 RepID=UPI003F95B533